jgi:hypothetical protein
LSARTWQPLGQRAGLEPRTRYLLAAVTEAGDDILDLRWQTLLQLHPACFIDNAERDHAEPNIQKRRSTSSDPPCTSFVADTSVHDSTRELDPNSDQSPITNA